MRYARCKRYDNNKKVRYNNNKTKIYLAKTKTIQQDTTTNQQLGDSCSSIPPAAACLHPKSKDG
jgi:hypothetical protein